MRVWSIGHFIFWFSALVVWPFISSGLSSRVDSFVTGVLSQHNETSHSRWSFEPVSLQNIWSVVVVSVCSITDTFEGFTLSLLSSLMISGPNSPFYKALIEPKIGTDFSSVVGCVANCSTDCIDCVDNIARIYNINVFVESVLKCPVVQIWWQHQRGIIQHRTAGDVCRGHREGETNHQPNHRRHYRVSPIVPFWFLCIKFALQAFYFEQTDLLWTSS